MSIEEQYISSTDNFKHANNVETWTCQDYESFVSYSDLEQNRFTSTSRNNDLALSKGTIEDNLQDTVQLLQEQAVQDPSGINNELVNKVFHRLDPFIYATIRKAGIRHDDIQDLAQEVRLKLFQTFSKAQFRGESKVTTFVYKVTQNTIRTHITSRKRHDIHIYDRQSTELQPDSEPVSHELPDEIVIDKLSLEGLLYRLNIKDREKVALLLKANKYKMAEIAAILGFATVGACGTYVMRSRNNAKEKLNNSSD